MLRRSSAAASFLLLSACADVPTEPAAPSRLESPALSVVGLTADQQFNHGIPILNCVLTNCSLQTGQTFIPNASNLAAVELYFSNFTSVAASANVTVNLRSGDMGGSLLGSAISLVTMNAGSSGQRFDFNFSSPIPVTPGLTYAIEVQGSSNTIAIMGARVGSNGLTVANMYPQGQAVTNGVPAGDTEDYYFATYADPSFNTPPAVATDDESVSADEGQTATNTGTVSDPELGAVSLSATVGTVVNNDDGTWSWSLATIDGPAESQTVTITADDGNGGSAMTSFELTVANVGPTVDAITVPSGPVALSDQPVSVIASFSDPAGAADGPFECTVDLDNGTRPTTGTVAGFECSVPDLTYAAPENYTVTFFLIDKTAARSPASPSRTSSSTNAATAHPSLRPTSNW